ncbi:MAG TPA: hypothetical protein VFE53_16450 [Mucilaginibacter sp.]|jgi:hypothetical protein|nr:hypothetical protein [Mucilaginibacter sp.]
MINLKRSLAGALFVIALIISNASANRVHAAPVKYKIFADSTTLKAFEGIYQAKDNPYSYIKVTAKNDTLIAKELDGERFFVLTRKSEFGFETKDDDGDETIKVVFSKNDAGDIAQISIGGEHLFAKIKNYVPPVEVKLTADQLKAFEGKYQFEQRSDAFLQITATADGLTLKQLWDGKEIKFMSLGNLVFLNKEAGFPLKFTKDDNGNVIKVLAFNRDMWDKVKE